MVFIADRFFGRDCHPGLTPMFEKDGVKSNSLEKSPFRPSLVSLFPSASSPLIRFFALLLIAVTLLAVAVCFWSHWKRRKGRRERRRAGDEQRHKGKTVRGGNGLLEEGAGDEQQHKGKTVRGGNGLLEEATV
uniref:Transmembrane protein n=1 Tax=Globodera pallida TaxID=36090 RepID=A0A183CN84_GLOPA